MARSDTHINYTCPHCGRAASAFSVDTDVPQSSFSTESADGEFYVDHTVCPGCNRSQIRLAKRTPFPNRPIYVMAWPVGGATRAVATEVPQAIAADYQEASAVLSISPKASAALSRRILQAVLSDHLHVKKGNLAQQIDAILETERLPTHLAESIDAVRNIGNFAAHPMKAVHSGEILPVEAGEAEWTLDVLDLLFDYVFVQPALAKEKRAALEKKIAAAGKPELKGPTKKKGPDPEPKDPA